MAESAGASEATQVYVNGQIIGGTPGAPPADAIAVSGGRIVGVGKAADLRERLGSSIEEVTDLHGKSVIPGLIDVHTHVAGHALDVRTAECRDFCDPKVDNIPEIMRRMAELSEKARPGEWVIGTGAMQQRQRLLERRWPSLEEMDTAVPSNPAYIKFGSHITVVNSPALAYGGITRDTPDPHGGRIERDPVTGELTGVLLEHAARPVVQKLENIYDFADLVDALEVSLRNCAARGVTCVHDMVSTVREMKAYQLLYRTGRLPIRVCLLMRVVNAEYSLESLPNLGIETGFGDDWLWFGGGKISIDGGFTGHTAAFKTTIDGKPLFEDPIIRVEQDELNHAIAVNQEAGIRMCIHAIGDLAVDQTLEAFEKAGTTAGDGFRHRIEHFGNWLCTPERLARCHQLGITPVPNPPFLYYLGEDAWNMLGGEEHYATTGFPFKTLAREGFRFSGGSDGPGYYSVDGLRDLASMAYRSSFDGRRYPPEEDLTVPEALHAQTRSAAWLSYRENSIGAIEVGKQADFLVLDTNDFMACSPEEIFAMPIVKTVVGGRVVYEG